jgi:2,4-diketo-3-deoxy-L-fuconate hydrolase
MRLIAFYGKDAIQTGRIEGDEVVVGGGPLDPTGRLGDEFADAIGWISTDPEERVSLARIEPTAIVLAPTKIVCVGLNYRDHAAEGGRAAPERPLLFAKFSNAIVGDGDPVVRPEGTHALDLEVELGVVIARRARRVTRDAAMEHVAGYLVVNDISARDWQGIPQALGPGEKGDGQWLRAKGSDTFLPMSPVLVTPDELDPAAGLRLRSWRIDADGLEHLMQDGTTADMIHDVPSLVAFISSVITLEPGDVIATGTPSGVGVFRDPPVFLNPGDAVRCEIEGIGSVENPIVDWSDPAFGA